MQSKCSNDPQRMEVQSYLLNELQSAIGSEGFRFFSYELEQTLEALRLLVDDIEQPIWGISLDALDASTRDQLDLFRAQPPLNMLFNGEVCIALAEWRDYFLDSFALQKDATLDQQVIEDRHFFRNAQRTNRCDDFQRFCRLLNAELVPEGLEAVIHVTDSGQFQVSIQREGIAAQGAIWRRWESNLNQIQMCDNSKSYNASTE